jgi:hypothetical protein
VSFNLYLARPSWSGSGVMLAGMTAVLRGSDQRFWCAGLGVDTR